ncbi:MAG: DNA polymerase III subunit gamma/tau, partial [Dehalococcoidales bacterium]|nr:DNA polymerase III subunit gamma/tau [Dehalococcoidales bacterium]
DNGSTLPLELALVDCALSSGKEIASPPSVEVESRQPARTPQPSKAATPSSSAKVTAGPATGGTTPPKVAETTAKPVIEAATRPVTGGTELERLKQNWKQVVAQAPEDTRKTPAMAILRSAGVKPVAMENDTVVLAFRYPLHKEKIGEPENQRVVARIISTFLGRTCSVRCIHEPEDNHLVREAQRIGAQVTSVEEK